MKWRPSPEERSREQLGEASESVPLWLPQTTLMF
jgi:hypothetical protein